MVNACGFFFRVFVDNWVGQVGVNRQHLFYRALASVPAMCTRVSTKRRVEWFSKALKYF